MGSVGGEGACAGRGLTAPAQPSPLPHVSLVLPSQSKMRASILGAGSVAPGEARAGGAGVRCARRKGCLWFLGVAGRAGVGTKAPLRCERR